MTESNDDKGNGIGVDMQSLAEEIGQLAERSVRAHHVDRLDHVARLMCALTYGEMIDMCTSITAQKDYKPPTDAAELATILHRWAKLAGTAEAVRP
jgi:hypothetical protein